MSGWFYKLGVLSFCGCRALLFGVYVRGLPQRLTGLLTGFQPNPGQEDDEVCFSKLEPTFALADHMRHRILLWFGKCRYILLGIVICTMADVLNGGSVGWC